MTFEVGWGQRAVGLVVLLACAGLAAWMRFDLPWPTWVVLGVFFAAALVSSLSNFGERLHADEEGLRWENVLLRRERRAPWRDVLSAVELDGRTFFLTVEGQRRWVLDAFDGAELLSRLLQEHGVSVEQRTRPRLRDLGRGSRTPPPA
jgi:hypothetical protein